MGKERLRSLTNDISSMLSQSTGTLITTIKKTADNDTIRQYLLTGRKELHEPAFDILKKLKTDSTTVLVELLAPDLLPLLSYSEAEESLQKKLRTLWKPDPAAPPSNPGIIGKMYALDKSIYFPIITTITNKKQINGYLVSWRLLATTPKAVEQISTLMGKGAVLYIGNTDGSAWTDMIRPVPHPPIDVKQAGIYFEYTDLKGTDVISTVQPINNSGWLVLIEFSKELILEGATRFFKWLIIAGGLLLIAGIFIAWLMSHKITKPLKQLTKAATAISKGDYSMQVQVDRKDELGELANAFNLMAEQVHATQLNLEHKVSERTAQLQTANKELEAFSYSVSHDLRAPLRGIIGFTAILEEEYGSKLDDEAKRITSVIRANTLKMGNLIDALLSFSRIGRNEITKMDINNNEMVKETIASLEPKHNTNPIKWVIGPLPDTAADINTMRQVWINLVSNAIKYSGGKDQPVIEIGSFIHEGQTAFFVKDNGVGFDEKYKDKLFKVFQRLHGAHEFEGTGVGLALIEKIISKHGGKVWAEGVVGQGATFYFSVPAV